jgi:hypothetical protein
MRLPSVLLTAAPGVDACNMPYTTAAAPPQPVGMDLLYQYTSAAVHGWTQPSREGRSAQAHQHFMAVHSPPSISYGGSSTPIHDRTPRQHVLCQQHTALPRSAPEGDHRKNQHRQAPPKVHSCLTKINNSPLRLCTLRQHRHTCRTWPATKNGTAGTNDQCRCPHNISQHHQDATPGYIHVSSKSSVGLQHPIGSSTIKCPHAHTPSHYLSKPGCLQLPTVRENVTIDISPQRVVA